MIIIAGEQIGITVLEQDSRFFDEDICMWKFSDKAGERLDEMLDRSDKFIFNSIDDLYGSLTCGSIEHPLPDEVKVFHNICNYGVKIIMTGDYTQDFLAASQEFGLTTTALFNPIDGRVDGYVWHHAEDAGCDTNGKFTCTMELLTALSHSRPHAGGVNIYRNAHGGHGYGHQ